MKDRERPCKYYQCEGSCAKGRAGTFRKQCQICDKYDPIPGSFPARKNLKHEKKMKMAADKRNWE